MKLKHLRLTGPYLVPVGALSFAMKLVENDLGPPWFKGTNGAMVKIVRII